VAAYDDCQNVLNGSVTLAASSGDGRHPSIGEVPLAQERFIDPQRVRRVPVIAAFSGIPFVERDLLERRFRTFETKSSSLEVADGVAVRHTLETYCLACGWKTRARAPGRLMEHLLMSASGRREKRRHASLCSTPLSSADVAELAERNVAQAQEIVSPGGFRQRRLRWRACLIAGPGRKASSEASKRKDRCDGERPPQRSARIAKGPDCGDGVGPGLLSPPLALQSPLSLGDVD